MSCINNEVSVVDKIIKDLHENLIKKDNLEKEQKRIADAQNKINIDTDNLNRKRKQNVLHREQLLKHIVVEQGKDDKRKISQSFECSSDSNDSFCPNSNSNSSDSPKSSFNLAATPKIIGILSPQDDTPVSSKSSSNFAATPKIIGIQSPQENTIYKIEESGKLVAV